MCVCVTGRVRPGLTPSPLTPPSVKIKIEVFVWWGIPKDSSPPFVLGTVRGTA